MIASNRFQLMGVRQNTEAAVLLVTPVASGDKLALLRRARGLRSRYVCIVSISYTPVFFNTLQLRTIIATQATAAQ